MKKILYITYIYFIVTALPITTMEEKNNQKENDSSFLLTLDNIRKQMSSINASLSKVDEKISIKTLNNKSTYAQENNKLATTLWNTYRKRNASAIINIHTEHNVSWNVTLLDQSPLTYAFLHNIPELKVLLIVHKQKYLKSLYQQTLFALHFLTKKTLMNIKLPKPLYHYIICFALEPEIVTITNEISTAEDKRSCKITNCTRDATYVLFLKEQWKLFQKKCDLKDNFFSL